jgi:glyoxylase-like metal-dependent hydrolase (beta-lactamase superfamily II)
MPAAHQPQIRAFFDESTNSVSYLVADPDERRAAVVDGLLDYDPASGNIATDAADRLLAAAADAGFTIDWILETHAHADHLSAARYLKARTSARTAIGARITEVRPAAERWRAPAARRARD